MGKDKKNYEYLLGLDPTGGYEIVKRDLNAQDDKSEAFGCLSIFDYGIFQDEVFPTDIDSSYVRIDKSDYEYVKKLLNDTKDAIEKIYEDTYIPMGGELKRGLCLDFEGEYLKIEALSQATGKVWLTDFYYDDYNLMIDDDWVELNDYIKDCDEIGSVDDLYKESRAIPEDIYEEMLKRTRDGIRLVINFLKELYNAKIKKS